MRTGVILAIAGWLCGAAFGQAAAPDVRVFKLTPADTRQKLLELADLIRVISDMRDVTVDTGEKSLTVHGTEKQIEFASWLVKGVDQFANGGSTGDMLEQKGDGDDVTRLLHLRYTPELLDFQGVATTIRVMTAANRLFTYNVGSVIAVRDQGKTSVMASWIAQELDAANGLDLAKRTGTHEYVAGTDDVMHLIFVPNRQTDREIQEIVLAAHGASGVRLMIAYTPARLVAVRGTRDQIAMSDWLLKELDGPVKASEKAPEYRVNGSADVIRIYRLPPAGTELAFLQRIVALRQASGITRAYTCNTQRIVVMRGTAEQLAIVEARLRDPATTPR